MSVGALVMGPDRGLPVVEPAAATRLLRDALVERGFSNTYQTDFEDTAVLSVWYNLTVWCMGGVFVWRTGYAFEDFDTHPADDPVGAARRIVERYDELRTRRDLYRG